MASTYVLEQARNAERIREVAFAGDGVRLFGQMNYPSTPEPTYPLIFVLHQAGWNTRMDYEHYARLGLDSGYAVFRWDKRGTGRSGGGGRGSTTQDAVYAYETALAQPKINHRQVIIIAQGDGTLMLGDSFGLFARVQRPQGVLLVGNMLDAQQILAIESPIHIALSDNDWHDWRQYARDASSAHTTTYPYGASYYVASNTDRSLLNADGSMHLGAKLSIQDWLASR